MEFAAHRESKLLKSNNNIPNKIHLATDRQVLVSNWNKQEDKRNTEIYAIGTACQKTGYVFGYHFNFDYNITQQEVEQVASQNNDINKPKHHRESARAWLYQEFDEKIKSSKSGKKIKVVLSDDESEIIDSGTAENVNSSKQLPPNGVLIHNEYTMMGHFLFVKKLLGNIPNKFFHLDGDAGMSSAMLSIFSDEVSNGTCHGTVLRRSKGQTVNQRRGAVAETNKLIYVAVKK